MDTNIYDEECDKKTNRLSLPRLVDCHTKKNTKQPHLNIQPFHKQWKRQHLPK